MEPDDDLPVHDLLGTGGEPEPGPAELRAIVARASRKRWVTVGVATTLALGLGLGVGFGTSDHSSPATQTASAPQSAAGATTGTGSNAVSPGTGTEFATNGIAPFGASTLHLTPLFTRSAGGVPGGVNMRAFLVSYPTVSGQPAACNLQGSRLQVEVSTAKMVGVVAGGMLGVDAAQPASGISSQVIGTAEGNPVAVVTAATGSGVAQVSMSFSNGTRDQMAPIRGWVALAAPVSSRLSYGQALGTLTERTATGKVIKSETLQLGVQSGVAVKVPCSLPCTGVLPQRAGASTGSNAVGSGSASGTASGSGTDSGSGSGTASGSGTGTASTATANSGSGTSGSANSGTRAAAGTPTAVQACPPVPCSSLPGVPVPPATTQGAPSRAVPPVAVTGSGQATYACPLHPSAAPATAAGAGAGRP
jgi:hypothetical protein